MLKLTGLVKTMPFMFTDMDGSDHELYITEYTIADVKKLVELQKCIVGNGADDVMETSEIIIASRIVCAVKQKETGEYFWDTVESMTGQPYPNELSNALYTEVNKLNPLDFGETDFDEKKSE